MKNDITDILFKYTTGEATLEETNEALKEAEAGFHLEPGKNEITPRGSGPDRHRRDAGGGHGLRIARHRNRVYGEGQNRQRQVGRRDQPGQPGRHDQYARLRHHRPQALRGQGRYPGGLLIPATA